VERCELSQRGLGRSPAEIEFVALQPKNQDWWQLATVLIIFPSP